MDDTITLAPFSGMSYDHTTTGVPYVHPKMDETFYTVMKTRLGVSTWLNTQCVIMNVLLLTFLFSYKEYRSWQFFPLMMQSVVDIIGPVISNMAFEWKLYINWPDIAARILEEYEYMKEPVILRSENVQVVFGIASCFLMHLRCLLNEYSTGYCILATAFYRYLLVCHPTSNAGRRISKKLAVILVLTPVLAMSVSVIDLSINDEAYMDIDFYGLHSSSDK